jgi:hypothetical protein
VACLRDLCGTSLAEVARRTGTTVSGSWSRYARHRELMTADAGYVERVSQLARDSLDACHGRSRI